MDKTIEGTIEGLISAAIESMIIAADNHGKDSGEYNCQPTYSTPEKRCYMVLSTRHLRKDTCLHYQRWPFIAEYDEGCYFHVGDNPEEYTDTPEDLLAVLMFAKEHGCIEVKFDTSADKIPELPVYDWE